MAHVIKNLWNEYYWLKIFIYGPWGRPDMALFKFTKSILQIKNRNF